MKINVIAASGVRVPVEDTPGEVITDATPVEVADSQYYRRRIADGDLLRVESVAPSAKSEPKEKK